MNTNKIAQRIGVGVAALALAGTGFSGSANAAPSDCPSGWYCVWSGQNYTGRMQKVEGDNADLTRFSVFQSFKSRFQNGKSCDFKWYSEKNYRGDSGVIKKGSKATWSTTHFIKSNKWVNCS
ncbi:peptidase inhibitor family I36 protein [Streptomyces sp. NPDC012510]|uniref:peptidase inhibitor family I36 protein n=1 Tax=Streptomyces sp. NPDC012510 TaxID=3364838 RepID=UPI0036E28A29